MTWQLEKKGLKKTNIDNVTMGKFNIQTKKNDEVRTFDHKHYGEEVPYQLSTVCVIDLGFI